ncbi:maestro heat-like repeat-containing protein family member 7 [Camelus dromedarius]|uniref:maestro heat-like repeat-containing protein family member 7 n=1 Tax=Camelus dromedarius TaxID=9838 RepID=UPI00311A5B14
MDFTTLTAMMRTSFSLFGDVRPDVHRLSMTLFGASVKSVKYTDKKRVESQVLDSLVPLLLYSQDENDAVAEESRRVLTICAQFLKWKLPQEVYCKDPWYINPSDIGIICKFFVYLRKLLHDPEPSLRIITTQALLQIHKFGAEPDPRQTA